jgi:hypothetical protein
MLLLHVVGYEINDPSALWSGELLSLAALRSESIDDAPTLVSEVYPVIEPSEMPLGFLSARLQGRCSRH